MGAAMKIDDKAAAKITKNIGIAKLWTAEPPKIAMGCVARSAVPKVGRASIWLVDKTINSRRDMSG